MLDYREVIWGIILTVISSMILGYLFGALGSFFAFLVVTVYVGYQVNEDLVNGALHGSLVAAIAGISSFLIMMVMWGIGIGPGSTIMEFGVMGIIIGILIDIIVGGSGGAIGSTIRR
jgi:hypothetical protein